MLLYHQTELARYGERLEKLKIYEIPTVKRKRGNQSTKTRRKYKDIVCAFDIETTALNDIEQSVMYVWMLQLGLEHETIIGRTWEEFLLTLQAIAEQLEEDEWIVIYVHNLSYEFQFLRGVYDFKPEEVFAVDRRKVLKCDMYNHFEFRCSYLHSNMSLDEYTKKMKVFHVKQSGEDFDYKKTRYPWTPLTDSELKYCTHDVLGLVEALTAEMEHDKDNLYTIPLTSTGYVRRDAKKAMRKATANFAKEQLPNYHIYTMLREAFRGGDTHANRYYTGKILTDVKSADMSSAYPSAVCNCKFPVTTFFEAGELTAEEIAHIINDRKKAVLARISFTKIELLDPYNGAPYLTRDKSRNIVNGLFDNGRVLSADYLETTLTDLDIETVFEEYKFSDVRFIDVAYASYGKLPKTLIETTINYYKAKTELKGVPGEDVFYMKSKNKLNSIYGMMAQNPVKRSILFTQSQGFEPEKPNQDETEQQFFERLLQASNEKAFLAYQWGVWVTAHVRRRLRYGIQKAGIGFVYCDTDSVKYIGNIDWFEYNEERKQESIETGAWAIDPSGESHYMGVYEDDGHYSKFATLGAKKYCYQFEDGKTHCTISGVNKKKGGIELDKHGGITAFTEGFVFVEAGGTESVYNDDTDITLSIDGHELHVTANVLIKDSTYTLGITEEYRRIIEDANLFAKLLDNDRHL